LTQSVTRNRWLTSKLLFGVLATAAAVGLLTWSINWWASPILATMDNRFDPALFGLQGVVPVGYAVFAFAIGAGTGLLFRRTVPAMATTIAAYVAARLAVTYWVRPHFAAPVVKAFPLTAGSDIGFAVGPDGARLVAGSPSIPNAYVLSSKLVDGAGHAPTAAWLQAHCPNLPGVNGQPVPLPGPGGPGAKTAVPSPFGVKDAFNECIAVASRTYHVAVTYQPGSRFWPFQFAELGLFLVVALLIGAGCFWWVRHRLA
ncbi:MAG TPA: hypothetical protein VE991_06880, partial [Acidimicrobiales bacterium]|nr:hypothetical protein [Acidimicrobiales bacterium]